MLLSNIKIFARVTPKAKSFRLEKEHLPDGNLSYHIAITALPEDGKANKAVIQAIAKDLKIPKSRLEITHGLTSRDKIIRVL